MPLLITVLLNFGEGRLALGGGGAAAGAFTVRDRILIVDVAFLLAPPTVHR